MTCTSGRKLPWTKYWFYWDLMNFSIRIMVQFQTSGIKNLQWGNSFYLCVHTSSFLTCFSILDCGAAPGSTILLFFNLVTLTILFTLHVT